MDHVDDQAHDDDDLAHPAYDADPAETDEADASHLEEHADDADADHNMVNTHGKDMKDGAWICCGTGASKTRYQPTIVRVFGECQWEILRTELSCG